MFFSKKKYAYRFKNRAVLVWFVMTLLPIVVLVIYVAIITGSEFLNFLTDPQSVNERIWQLQKWNPDETSFRYINSVILEDPERLLIESTYKPIIRNHSIKPEDAIILIRKDEDVKAINNFETDEGRKIVSGFNKVTGPILPEFGGYYTTKNEELFNKTGYIVARQLDFYFKDGGKGSVFFLTKVINIPSQIGKFVVNYFIALFIILIIFMIVFFLYSAEKLTKNFNKVVTIIDEVSKENFTNRLDITDEPLVYITHPLNAMIEKLAESKEYRASIENNRNDFISNMTHDIKTPLTSIRVQIEALNDGVVKEPHQISNYYNNIRKKLSEIDKMMNELQLYNELETESMTFELETVDLKFFFKDVVDELQFDPSYKGVHFDYKVDEKEPLFAWIDPSKLKRVITNVLMNSMKYSKQAHLIFKITLKAVDDLIEIEMIDNGVGVPVDELENIFTQYYRIDPARNQQVAGSGLGLAICRSIVSRHSGKITAFTDTQSGFGIRITLPQLGAFDEKNFID
ncbi:sensor histidine kinase KdpD [Fusibacter sp. 3D3]|uniref:sensor histidine kinase n=1 Tax=Fusibacter sp. 3D3 TaxID=1048380 RepID=UPI000853194E|nr:HAMP domain-containing sensor histidine kinase [Fusibacter sp. 3D3]GAU77249.1 two-component sensor kinase SA14-24 [Fusibacter sp. 3D3]